MKFRVFLFILFLGIANAFASDLDFTLVNQTARSFEGLYITGSGNKDWDANLLLDGKVLAAGGKVRVRFKSDAKSETWDFRCCVTLEAHTDLSPSGQHFSIEKEICIPILVSRAGDIETFKASRGLVHQREVEIGRECVCDA